MSDMPRPRPLPPTSDHERHDALLVAQFVAGDPLKPEQQAEAQRLVAGCGGCAALAADLPAVSRAVAHESVPPRRRDYRLSPEQAEELRGNALTRLLRRLSVPSSRAFQPLAAGVLSIGLLFVIAGYAWPENGTIVVQAEPNLVDWPANTSALPAAEPAEEPAAPSVAHGTAAPAPAMGETEALQGAERAMEESAFADSLAASQAGTADGLTQQSDLDEYRSRSTAQEVEEFGEAIPADSPVDEVASLGAAADIAPEGADAEDGSGGQAARKVAPDAPGDADDAPAIAVGDASQQAEESRDAEIAPSTDDGGAELLIVLGLILALGGVGLLLLGWLARRAKDPLAP